MLHDLFEEKHGIWHPILLLENKSFEEKSLGVVLAQLQELIEVIQCVVIILHQIVQSPSFQQCLFSAHLVHLHCARVFFKRPVIVPNALQRVSYS